LGIQAATATWALAELELSLGRGAEAYTHWDAFYGGDPEGPNQAIRNVSAPSYIEACVRSGHHEAARAEIEHVESWARGAEANAYLPLVARSHALIAPETDAAARFDEALTLHAADDRPFDRARTELAYGEFLRRGRARRAARDHLRTALQVFEQLGAVLWAERARAELRASGETARKRDPSTMDALTPQELQIARFVSGGATNKEVAAQLFLSPRTIDFHLRNVFSKLGISSRRELSRFRLEDGAMEVAGEGPVTSPVQA
jgi:DNA-binding CsgD family transcriptional regulator